MRVLVKQRLRHNRGMLRRRFLSLGSLVLPRARAARAGPSLQVIPGPVNGVLLSRGSRRLAIYGDPRDLPAGADEVLLTHFRRDVVWAARALQRRGASVTAPATEAALIDAPEAFWRSFSDARFHDYAMLNTKVLAQPLPVTRAVRGGDRIEFEGLGIEVLDTPGYSPGAVSYLFTVDDRRVACTGDLIYEGGRLFDLWSLQDAVPDAKLRGYHGYAARAGELIRSLRALAARKPDLLIPARGPVIENPQVAMDTLITRVKAALREHFTTDALRWYFGDDNLRLRAGKLLEGEMPAWMPMAETVPRPPWLIAMGNSRLLLSQSGNGFLIDCGYDKVIEELRRLQTEGRLRRLEGVHITHYHDDHTDRAQACADAFQCPVYFTRELQDILENPRAWRMPCLSPFPIRSGRPMPSGARLRWYEFELTWSYFPGQTLFHDSLLARKESGESILFVGDSFTPSGLDDYCLWNRNSLAENSGFLACLAQLRGLPPGTLLVNQHVEPMFRFSAAQLDFMEQSLRRRREALRELFPWPDPDFGLDEQWIRLAPYEVAASTGRPFELRAVIMNHDSSAHEFVVRPDLPAGWTAEQPAWRLPVAARSERSATMRITPAPAARGGAVVTTAVEFGPFRLREWTEAIVRVG